MKAPKINLEKIYKDLISLPTDKDVLKYLSKLEEKYGDRISYSPLGGDESNYSTVKSLNTSSLRALVEILMNAIDHTLLGDAKDAGIDPTSKDAPQSPSEAIKTLYGVPDGNIGNIKGDKKFKIPQVYFSVGGVSDPINSPNVTDPTITIADFGEGQLGKDFIHTFFKLKTSSKRSIPMVQGKHGRGINAAFAFCDVSMISSIRRKSLGGNGNTAFSLVIRKDPDPSKGQVQSHWAYLTIDGEIPEFLPSEKIKVLPNNSCEIEVAMTTGTFVKLYSYQLPNNNFRGGATFSLCYELTKNFYEQYLPIKFFETREKHQTKGHTLHKTLYGMKVQHMQTGRDRLDTDPIPFGINLGANYGKVKGTAFLFNHDKLYNHTGGVRNEDGEKESFFHSKGQAIVLLVNGQVHGTLSNAYFTRKSIKLDILKDDIYVALDITNLNPVYLEKMLMVDRERIVKESELFKLLDQELEIFLASEPTLKKKAAERLQELISKKTDEKNFSGIFSNLLASNKSLKEFFKNGFDFGIDGDGGKSNKQDIDDQEDFNDAPSSYVGSDEANFLNACRDIVDYPCNWRGTVSFKSDIKKENIGDLTVALKGVEIKSQSFHEGRITLNIKAPQNIIEQYSAK